MNRRHGLVVLCYALFVAGCAGMYPGMATSGDGQTSRSPNDVEHENMMNSARNRSGMARSVEPDRWWSDWLMSPQARNIENSLGVEYH